MDKITTVIKREWLRQIVSGRKRVEYRDVTPYWISRLARVKAPFLLRLINGMDAKAPEVTVLIDRIRRDSRAKHFALHIKRLVEVRHWDRKREQPAKT